MSTTRSCNTTEKCQCSARILLHRARRTLGPPTPALASICEHKELRISPYDTLFPSLLISRVTNVILIKASLRRLAVGYERGFPSLNFPPFPALLKEEFLRPTFLPSAFFYSGTGLWVGRYISSSGEYFVKCSFVSVVFGVYCMLQVTCWRVMAFSFHADCSRIVANCISRQIV